MRTLVLLRGSPCAGKTTWIEKNGLKPYTLSADDIRKLYRSPKLDVSGKQKIDFKFDGTVWELLFEILEERMKNGEFTVIDAVNSKTDEMNRYKKLAEEYRYRMFCVDFTGVPVGTVKERNRNRPDDTRVSEEGIDNIYSRFATQKIPSGLTVIKPDELDRIWFSKIDLTGRYDKIHIFGDIHGCYSALKEYLDSNGGIRDSECYIFCGDYLDRGLENVETINFLFDIYSRENVMLIQGNHERHIMEWANNRVSQSKEFEFRTKTQLEAAGVSKKRTRMLYRAFLQCAYFSYCGGTYLVTHGGISTLPENLTLVPTMQLIKGVGEYQDHDKVDRNFAANTPDGVFQVHGHRNVKHLAADEIPGAFNLEGYVEAGGDLRVLQLTPDGRQTVVCVENKVFDAAARMSMKKRYGNIELTVADMIMALRQSEYVTEKQFGNISSFNFSREAFFDKAWNEQTVKARGLYINIPKQKIVARSFEKFMNIGEGEDMELDALYGRLKFPLTAYVKENGFLGMAAYNDEDDDLFVTTKSSPEGDFAAWLKQATEALISKKGRNGMKEYSKAHDVTFVFECVLPVLDPHIVEYGRDRLVLLDIVRNTPDFETVPYEEMVKIANSFGLEYKQKAFVIDTWPEFVSWLDEVRQYGYRFCGKIIEGFVIEDATGFMMKQKTGYYLFWKYMRSIACEAIRKGYIEPKKTATLTTPLANFFYGWVKTLHPLYVESPVSVPMDIISLRNTFFKTEAGRNFAD